ncbi:MAG: carboxypeptidase regulatory-like domain-containing protein [Acidobacteria bacterium]|nr:carboxypeptidase regulatory-like domain-containing protein [Acidobacteriota bacterium]
MRCARAPALLLAGLLVPAPAAAAVAGSIKGTVHDLEGKARPGVQVRLHARTEGTVRVFVTHTDARGEYRFEDLPGGTYDLEAGGQGLEVGRKESISVRPPFRNVLDFSLGSRTGGTPESPRAAPEGTSTPPPAAAGEATGTVSGTLLDGAGLGVPDARIVLQGETRALRGLSDPDGRFRLDRVPAGGYRLEAHSPGYLAVILPGLAVGGSVGLELRLTLVEYPLEFPERVEDLLPPERPVPPGG